ncbi:hypothetical protein [uncultured Cohaesibacter sp.]|uniref:hypothetical protein n=1 Tax=uncultured Cohaesibacter sp. TaxID=1002546 RepID=UPI002A0A49C9|nr:hypothetical protein [uncultured Cohaesibacter sp.]
MNKLTLVLSALAFTAVASGAQASTVDRVDSQKMSTSQLQQLVQDRGEVILTTGPDLFDRYVANGSKCLIGETTKRAYVPTADSSSAFIGYTCETSDPRSN